jgi:hypothetical protein
LSGLDIGGESHHISGMDKYEKFEAILWLIIIGLLVSLFAWLGLVKATCVLISLWLIAKFIEFFS